MVLEFKVLLNIEQYHPLAFFLKTNFLNTKYNNHSIQRFFFAYFGPGGLRAPCVLVCAMRSLAIVITIVQSFSLSFSLLVQACLLRHPWWQTKQSWPLFSPTFFFFSSFFICSTPSAFHPLQEYSESFFF